MFFEHLWACLLNYFMWAFFFFKQKTAYEMRISDWSSDVCSSDLAEEDTHQLAPLAQLVVDVTPFLALLAQLRQEARRLGVRKARGAHELEARLDRRCQRIGELAAQICRDRTWHPELVGEHVDRKSTRMNSSHSCAHRMTLY